MRRFAHIGSATCMMFALATAAGANAADEPTFWSDIRPVFQKHCTVCHSAKNIEKKEIAGGLALTTFDSAVKTPKQPVVVPGKSDESKLFQVLVTKDEDKRMPKDGDALAAAAIELIKRWIDAGANEGERPAAADAPSAAAVATVKRPKSLVRSMDLVLPTMATITPEGAKLLDPLPVNPGALSLALKIAPLAPATSLAFSPDGKWLVVGCHGSVAVWDILQAELVKSLDAPGNVHSVAFSPDGSRLAAAGGLPARSGAVQLFDTSNWTVVATLTEFNDVVYSVAFSPDRKLLATASLDKTVKVWSIAESKLIQSLKGHSDFVYGVAFTPDGKRLVTSGKDRSIKVFSTESWQSERTLSGHAEDVLTIAVSPDSKTVVSAGKEPQLRWWTIEDGKLTRTESGHKGTVSEIVFSRDGKRVASVGQDKTVRIWDAGEGKQLREITGANEWHYAVAFSPDAKIIAAAGWDGLVRVWETETGRPLGVLIAPRPPEPNKPQWLAITPEGYLHASEELAALAEWRTAGHAVTGSVLTATLRKPELARKGLRAEPIEAATVDLAK